MLDKVGEWLGNAAQDVFGWLFNGIGTIFGAIFDGLNGIFDVFDSVWGFILGLIDSVVSLVGVALPFVPPEVLTVITAALPVVLVVGIIKLIRGSK